MNRRQILKLGLSSTILAMVSPWVMGQSGKAPTAVSNPSSAAVEDTIAYNAGWVIQLDDKARLLEIEARKNQEKEDLVKQKAGKQGDGTAAPKEKSKSIGDKMQDWVGKIKNFF